MTARSIYAAALATACVAIFVAGCSPSGSDTSPTVTTTATKTSTRALAATGGSSSVGLTPLGDANTEMKTARPEVPAQLVVTNIRLGSHEGFDRLVVDFVGTGDPGWHINYEDRPTQLASGLPVEYSGKTALNINIDGTTYPFEIGVQDFTPRTITSPDTRVIEEAKFVGSFESNSQLVVGLKDTVPYSVTVLHEPTRLVLDFVRK
ncbi:AMIN-like domain-containing (lipo)protein [Corynebacterium caspium]|uniref:AMIN-like domain-containing (lipo)protein n=1 Tax=Corynebacterium caspium TaxID=234828 RepID=UPI00035C9DC7|nr:hypothetical protein [Corynebacterium caspium]WKD59776.1 hypothetical protein CCASP_06985 [Corynebacterium caspium DSM 44850]